MPESKVTYANKNTRLNIFYPIYGALFLVLISALGYRQIYLYEKYVTDGKQQSMRRVIKPGARGDIFDRNGNLLVGNKAVFSAVVYKERAKEDYVEEYRRIKEIVQESGGKVRHIEIRDVANRAIYKGYMDKINGILGSEYEFDYDDFIKKYSAYSVMPRPLLKNLSLREHAILAERLGVNSAIELATETARYYPFDSAAAHMLGTVKSVAEEIDDSAPGSGLRTYSYIGKRGNSGMEQAFDGKLSGKVGTEIWVVDPSGNRYEEILRIQPRKGEDIHTSIDIDLQLVADAALNGRKGALVALDIKSGEVLAMSSSPSYDLNLTSPLILRKDFNDIEARGAFLNRATMGLYPPGSTFKLAVAVAGLESGAITLDSVSHCTGSLQVGNRKVLCNSRYGHGWVNLSDAIAKSCNVFFYEHGLKMGIEQISETAKGFGLDSSTGVEIGDAWRNTVVANPAYKKKYRPEEGPWLLGDTANVSIGQGMMLQTPLQMACFAASLARAQTRTRASVIHDTKRITDMHYHGAQTIKISPEEYGAVLHGMEEAVRIGTCKRAAIPGVRIAAKSGTAQVREKIEGKYKDLDLAWMVAFAPADKPEIAIAVVIQGEELNDVSGGATAGPVVRSVLEQYLKSKNAASAP